MDYTGFSTDDFICDEYFQNWIVKPDAEADGFWNNWLEQHPEKRATVEEARNLLVHLTFKEHFPTAEQVQNSLAATLSIIHGLEEQPPRRKATVLSLPGLKQLIKIAAIFIVIAFTGSMLYYSYWNAKETISTAYSEIKTLVLPDGSRVVLNAHSTLSYFKHERKSRPRQVWLDGEAFFEVRHINKNENDIKEGERFIVSTSDLNVRVLGTSFDVKKRAGKTAVILVTGKVRLDFIHKIQPAVTMLPGQMVVYDQSHPPVLQLVDPENYITWIDKKLVLKDASVNEITQYIQDYYGYKVILDDTAIGNKRMEGTLLLDDMRDVLFVLSSTLNIKVEKMGDTLIFKTR